MDGKEVEMTAEADCSSSVVSNNNSIPEKSKEQRRGFKRNMTDVRRNPSREEAFYNERLQNFGPTVDLPPLQTFDRKFANRNRLYVGNLQAKTTTDDLENLFKPYGETSDSFVNSTKNFGFIKLDYYGNALRAKNELNGFKLNGKDIMVRFAYRAVLHVTNLPQMVSNELLHLSFSIFGEIETCYIKVDERGKSKGEAIIEFVKKNSAMAALKFCTENCFFLTSIPKPVIVELSEETPDGDGIPEITIRKSQEYYRARECPPRFAKPGTFEFDYAKNWKELHNKYKEKFDVLNKERQFEEGKLEAEMMRAQYDHETERLKEMLRIREMERERYKQQWEMRQHRFTPFHEDHKLDDTLRMRQDPLFVQANQLSSILDNEERQLQEQWHLAGFNGNNSEMYQNQSSSSIWTKPGDNYKRKRQRH